MRALLPSMTEFRLLRIVNAFGWALGAYEKFLVTEKYYFIHGIKQLVVSEKRTSEQDKRQGQ